LQICGWCLELIDHYSLFNWPQTYIKKWN